VEGEVVGVVLHYDAGAADRDPGGEKQVGSSRVAGEGDQGEVQPGDLQAHVVDQLVEEGARAVGRA
jgi:hypothetical protein